MHGLIHLHFRTTKRNAMDTALMAGAKGGDDNKGNEDDR
jgi:hypothetical protein